MTANSSKACFSLVRQEVGKAAPGSRRWLWTRVVGWEVMNINLRFAGILFPSAEKARKETGFSVTIQMLTVSD